MSKRAPSADTVPVRRATWPSTASRTSATAVSATSTATGVGRRTSRRSAPRPRTTSTARASVTRSAGPSRRSRGGRGRERAPVTSSPQATPTTQPAAPRPTVGRAAPSSASSADEPDQRTGLNPTHRASVSRGTRVHTGYGGARFTGHRRRGEVRPVRATRARSGCASPACGEIRPVRAAATRAPARCWCARCAPASAAAPRRWSSAAACPASQYAAMRAPFQEGDFPGPVKYGYLNVGVVEQGPPELRGRTVFCLYPHQTAYVVPADGRDRRARRRARPRGRCSPAPSRPRSTRCGTPRRWSATGSPSSAPGMVGCCVARLLARFPGVQVTLVDVDPARADVAAALGVDFAAARRRRRTAATWSCTPARPRPGCSGRSTCSRRRARSSS